MADRAIAFVRDGRSEAVVVVAAEADARVRDAVADLVRVVARMSGATPASFARARKEADDDPKMRIGWAHGEFER